MSLKTIIRKSGTKGDIRYLDEGTVGAGGQLTKVWKMRHHNVPGRLAALTRRLEILYFDRQKVFADLVWMMRYKSEISTRDRLYVKGKTFLVKHIANWDEQDRYLLLAVTEMTND